MCDFKPGDDVVCVDDAEKADRNRPPVAGRLAKGKVYTVFSVAVFNDEVGVLLVGNPSTHPTGLFLACRFRKIERRNNSLSIEAFRTIKDGAFEEPKRTTQPAKKEQADA